MTSLQKKFRKDFGMRIASYPALSERVYYYGELVSDLKEIEDYKREVAIMELALAAIMDDPYYPIIEMYYFEGKTDREISARLFCDRATVTRNRRRLVSHLASILYDTDSAASLQAEIHGGRYER